jgi:hypothetical protein
MTATVRHVALISTPLRVPNHTYLNHVVALGTTRGKIRKEYFALCVPQPHCPSPLWTNFQEMSFLLLICPVDAVEQWEEELFSFIPLDWDPKQPGPSSGSTRGEQSSAATVSSLRYSTCSVVRFLSYSHVEFRF